MGKRKQQSMISYVLPSQEMRSVSFEAKDLRIVGDPAAPLRLAGYAAVFNTASVVMEDWWAGEFVEYIASGAFAKSLDDGDDVRFLLNHDPNWVMGRTKSNTLRLWEDDHGLGFEVTPPDVGWTRDLMESVKRGDINQASFGFRTIRDRWSVGKLDERDIDERWLLELKLFDASLATFPAYPDTEVSVRSRTLWVPAYTRSHEERENGKVIEQELTKPRQDRLAMLERRQRVDELRRQP